MLGPVARNGLKVKPRVPESDNASQLHLENEIFLSVLYSPMNTMDFARS